MGARARKQPKQARSRELVRAVIEGAARVVRREGLSATTNRIAAEAGVSIGSLYQYFPNKECLMLTLAERHLDQLEASLGRVVDEVGAAGSVRAVVAPLVGVLVADRRAHPRMHQIMRDFAARNEGFGARFERLATALHRVVRAHLVRLRPDVAQPTRKARFVLAAVDGVAHADADAETVHELVTMCVAYLEA